MQIFGLAIAHPIAVITCIILAPIALIGLIALYKRGRKAFYYGFVSAFLSFCVAMMVPFIVDQLVIIQQIPSSPLLGKFIWASQTSVLTLAFKTIFGWGFTLADFTFKKHND